MSQATPSACACPTPVTTEVPGSPGAAGTNGTNGWNAFSILQASFIVPPINSTVTVSVDQAEWMVVGQDVFVQGAGYFSVNAIVAGSPPTIVTLLYLNVSGNTNAGNTAPAGGQISPAGPPAIPQVPIIIAQGGTGASTQSGAQYNLGLGQTGTTVSVTGLTQAVTNSATTVAGAVAQVPQSGLYLVIVTATIDLQGATFAGNQTISLTARDTTTATVLATQVANTGTMTTLSFPSFEYVTPPTTVQLNGGDNIAAQIQISTTPSAGTIKVSSATVALIPLAL